jgi:CubicO group peptidase (beta-lactamase class C family)
MKDSSTYWSKVALALAVIALLAPQGTALAAQPRADKIDELMTAYHQLGRFNGAVLVAENGKVIYKKGLGLANMEWNLPNEPDTKFRLGSITKQFTATLIMQLVEQGKVKLDEKVSTYLPEYRKDTGGKVTVHQLLNHTSGIPSYTSQPGFFENTSRDPYTVVEFVKQHASGDLEFEPGAKFSYNNSGYFLLGAIIEKVTGKSYEQALKENILDPAGMKNTGYDHWGTVIKKRASGYTKDPDGYKNAAYLDMSLPYAAGSLYSTVEDLYLWDQALYGDKLLSAKSRELMFTPNLENYGYGWVITKAPVGDGKETVASISHGGGINGFSTLITRLVDSKHLIVLLDNTSQGGHQGGITANITNILYDKPYTLPKPSIAEAMLKTILERDLESAIKQYRDLKAKDATAYDFGEGELNMLGYQLLGTQKTREAIEVFKLNVEAYPQGANTYDSLAEAYMVNGDKALAIENYKKSLQLNPQNAGAKDKIKQLESPEVKVATAVYDAYVGEYELAPGFVLAITKEGEKLMAQATGQPKVEIFPESETKFVLRVVDAQITFVKDEGGRVTGLILHQGGRDVPGKKVK